jgi:hypothetical protein
MTALRTALTAIEFQVNAAVGGKLSDFVGFALASAAGRSAAARTPSTAATRRRLLVGRPAETFAMRRRLCGTNGVMGSPLLSVGG